MAVEAFLKIDGIDGESKDDKHKDWIEVTSFSWGETLPSAQPGTVSAGRATFSDVHVTKHIDVASTKLMQVCASGEHIKTASLTCRKAGGDQQDFLVIKLTDVLVSGVSTGGVEVLAQVDGDRPKEAIAFVFATVQMTYRQTVGEQKFNDVASGFDLKTSKVVATVPFLPPPPDIIP